MLPTMVIFDELIFSEKRLLIRKIIVRTADYYATLDNPIFKEFTAKIYFKLETLTAGLEQKISNKQNSTEIFDIA